MLSNYMWLLVYNIQKYGYLSVGFTLIKVNR